MEEYYKEGRDFHLVLELPDDIKDLVGSGSLIIEMEVDIREKEGWQEQLKYIELGQGYIPTDLGYAYKLHTTSKSWPEAEYECQKGGGNLASVTSESAVNKRFENNLTRKN